MVVGTKAVMCTAKPAPRPWQQGGRAGITYRATISDGETALDLRCANAEVYEKLKPFKQFQVSINLVQAAQDDRVVERAQIVDVKEVA